MAGLHSAQAEALEGDQGTPSVEAEVGFSLHHGVVPEPAGPAGCCIETHCTCADRPTARMLLEKLTHSKLRACTRELWCNVSARFWEDGTVSCWRAQSKAQSKKSVLHAKDT